MSTQHSYLAIHANHCMTPESSSGLENGLSQHVPSQILIQADRWPVGNAASLHYDISLSTFMVHTQCDWANLEAKIFLKAKEKGGGHPCAHGYVARA